MAEVKKQLLIIDDDVEIRDLLGKFMTQQQFEVTLLPDGKALLKTLAEKSIDLIILDIMLPGDDGFELCRQVRKQTNIPIIMLTAVSEETDRIIGLELGADDYLTKPFNPRELLARIKAILRRANNQGEASGEAQAQPSKQKLSFSGWQLDKATRRLLAPDEAEVVLSAGEYDLLTALLEHPQRIVSRDFLLDITRNRDAGPFDRSIDVQISRLRQKLKDDPKQPRFIKTIRNGGYMFAEPVEKG